MDKYLVNYNNYTSDGKHRVAVFGLQKDKTLVIFQLRCNIKTKNERFCGERVLPPDQFSKSLAKRVFEKWLDSDSWETRFHVDVDGKVYHPKVLEIPIENEDSVQFTLNQYCIKNYRKIKVYEKLVDTRVESVRIKKQTVNGTILELKELKSYASK